MKAFIQTKITVNETNNKLQKKETSEENWNNKTFFAIKTQNWNETKNHNRPEMMEIENFRFKKSTNAIN